MIRLEVTRSEDGLIGLLDTGFNGEVYLSADVAAGMRFEAFGDIVRAELAGGRIEEVQRALLSIRWLGVERTVEALVAPRPVSPRRGRPDEPMALVGTGLLHPHLVLLDFAAGTIEIEAQS